MTTVVLPVQRGGKVVGYTLVDDGAPAEVFSGRWGLAKDGYARRAGNKSLHRVVCRLVTGDGRVVHHINEDKLDNRRANLEVCESASEANGRPHPLRDQAAREGFYRYLQRIRGNSS